MGFASRSRSVVRRSAHVLPLLLTAAWLTACTSAAPTPAAPTLAPTSAKPAAPATASGAAQTSPATGTPIKIGYMADANGTSAPIAAGMHLGTDLAVEQVNTAGGNNGHPLKVTYVDPQSDPTQASQMATQLIQTDKVDVLMGAVLSSECLVVQQLVHSGLERLVARVCRTAPHQESKTIAHTGRDLRRRERPHARCGKFERQRHPV
jgi:hypothetical protein